MLKLVHNQRRFDSNKNISTKGWMLLRAYLKCVVIDVQAMPLTLHNKEHQVQKNDCIDRDIKKNNKTVGTMIRGPEKKNPHKRMACEWLK